MINKSLFSSYKQTWETPIDLFNLLNQEFHFECDVACDKTNCLCRIGITEDENALEHSWYSINYCNPPYDRKLQNAFINKAHDEAQNGNTTVMLIPARTDVKIFHDIILKYNYEIRFIKGRLKFSNSKNSAPFPSMIVIFKKDYS